MIWRGSPRRNSHGGEHVRQRDGRDAEPRREKAEQALGRLAEVLRGRSCATGAARFISATELPGGLGAVVVLLHAHDERRVAGGGAEERRLRPRSSNSSRCFSVRRTARSQMADVELRFVEIEQRLGEEGVVVEKARNGGVALAVAAQQHAGGVDRTCASMKNSAARRAACA